MFLTVIGLVVAPVANWFFTPEKMGSSRTNSATERDMEIEAYTEQDAIPYCYNLRKYSEVVKGDGFFERALIVSNARAKGLCKD